jgi:hypothetical protein
VSAPSGSYQGIEAGTRVRYQTTSLIAQVEPSNALGSVTQVRLSKYRQTGHPSCTPHLSTRQILRIHPGTIRTSHISTQTLTGTLEFLQRHQLQISPLLLEQSGASI